MALVLSCSYLQNSILEMNKAIYMMCSCTITVCFSRENDGSTLNKRAHGALGRSPEKKVKGHSGAIYRGPLM